MACFKLGTYENHKDHSFTSVWKKSVHPNSGVDYYAFGLAYNSYQRENSIQQPYQYSGKEIQDELNLQWMDFGARMYDAQIGRWHVKDPLADLFTESSPYSYAYNNPLRFTDPLGMANEDEVKKDEQLPDNQFHGQGEDGKWYASTYSYGNNNTGSSSTVAGCAYCSNGFGGDLLSGTKVEMEPQQGTNKISLASSNQQQIINQLVNAIYDAKKNKKSTIDLANYFKEYALSIKDRRRVFAKLGFGFTIQGVIKIRDGGAGIKVVMNIAISEYHSVIPASPDGSQDMGKDGNGIYQFFNYNYEGTKQDNALLIKGYLTTDNDYERFNNFIW